MIAREGVVGRMARDEHRLPGVIDKGPVLVPDLPEHGIGDDCEHGRAGRSGGRDLQPQGTARASEQPERGGCGDEDEGRIRVEAANCVLRGRVAGELVVERVEDPPVHTFSLGLKG